MNTHRGIFKMISRLAILPVLLLCAAMAHATPAPSVVTINFTGKVLGSSPLNARGIWGSGTQGYNVTGSFSYNAALLPTVVLITPTNTTNTFLSNLGGNSSFNSDWKMTFTLGTTTRTVTVADGLFNFGLFDRVESQTQRLTDLYSFTGGANKASLVLNGTTSQDSFTTLNGLVPTSAPDLSLFGGLKQGTYNREAGFVNFLKFDILTVSAVPEPEVYAMLLSGLGLVGFVARRRRLRESA